jgi:adenylylsulfate kinase-like enzyme
MLHNSLAYLSFVSHLCEMCSSFISFVFFLVEIGSGKSTVANALRVRLLELGGRAVSLLDGDVIRGHLSSELTFSKEHR